MSRLIVKNLPAYVTPDRLKQHFSQAKAPAGTITDIKVALKRDGTSRRFGFVGYKTSDEAVKAQAWFDNTFIDSTRVRVEVVDGAKDAPAPRPNKRPRVDPTVGESGSSDTKVPNSKKPLKGSTAAGDNDKPKDSQLDSFMEVMQPKARTESAWANDEPTQLKKSKKGKEPASDDQDGEEDTQMAEGLSDMEWMRRRMKQGVEEAGKAFVQSDDEDGEGGEKNGDKTADPPPQDDKDPNRDTILQTGRLFVRNLAFSCTEGELRELFQPYGEVSQVYLPIDPITKQPKGLAYVKFAQPTSAFSAFESLDKRSFQGRLLHIMGAVDRKGNLAVEGEGVKKRSLKEDRNTKRKAGAGKEFNWSMLYMNSDAVLSSVADRMNVSKADILDPESPNAAVKLALAETHVIQETKAYLESQGVILSSLSGRGRSDTTILVKNIPYGTTAEQIREMFEVHGTLSRVLVPPAGTMAVVEFVHSDEASAAFRAIAYRRLGNSVIYLEKGPLGMFQDPSTDTNGPITADGVKANPVTIDDKDADAGEEPTVAAGTTLFIKNLAFSITTERLTQVFRHLPSFSFARVQTKSDPKRPTARLSMGYGFIGFKAADAAKKAIKGIQGYVLDGHALTAKFAGRGAEEETEEKAKGAGKSSTTKMLVKNLPFEATRKDVRELFGTHGQLKSVRVPKRFDHRTRGFAFLEFVSRHEAENAYNALKHTHLLGRHLVLEWAKEGDMDIEQLRKKAGVGLGDGKELPGKKKRLVLDEDEADGEEDV